MTGHDGGLTVFVVLGSDVCQLPGERLGDLLHGPPAHPVEERGATVSSAQPGSVPEAGGGRRTDLRRCCLQQGGVFESLTFTCADTCLLL